MGLSVAQKVGRYYLIAGGELVQLVSEVGQARPQSAVQEHQRLALSLDGAVETPMCGGNVYLSTCDVRLQESTSAKSMKSSGVPGIHASRKYLYDSAYFMPWDLPNSSRHCWKNPGASSGSS